jgi:plasmid stabilization system protein ParE
MFLPTCAVAIQNEDVDDVERAILKRLENPEIFRVYISSRGEKYRRIRIRNYFVMYVVYNDIMEVRRFIYAGRDLEHLL